MCTGERKLDRHASWLTWKLDRCASWLTWKLAKLTFWQPELFPDGCVSGVEAQKGKERQKE